MLQLSIVPVHFLTIGLTLLLTREQPVRAAVIVGAALVVYNAE